LDGNGKVPTISLQSVNAPSSHSEESKIRGCWQKKKMGKNKKSQKIVLK
jgi:hypothetical protein